MHIHSQRRFPFCMPVSLSHVDPGTRPAPGAAVPDRRRRAPDRRPAEPLSLFRKNNSLTRVVNF